MLLKNNTGEVSRVGHLCKVDPKDRTAFVYAGADETNILGVITQSKPRYAQCEIATSGTAKVFVFERAVQGAVIRAAKGGDNISRGTCKTMKTSDGSYFKIGVALESGKGLINCALGLSYNGSTGAVANGTYIIGLGIGSDGVVVIENGIITSITEAT